MSSNNFGQIFKISTFGESHGKAIGVVIDGCPAGLSLTEDDIFLELKKRRPGFNSLTSPRKEEDRPIILSGIFENKTTGAPICILIENQVKNSYEEIKDLLRPSHGNFTYLQKYGIFDYRGGGRASARETACRVAAGAIAKKILKNEKIEVLAFLKKISDVEFRLPLSKNPAFNFQDLQKKTYKSPLFCPDKNTEKKMLLKLNEIKKENDSIGGIIEVISTPLPPGLGDPAYEKLSANLAKALFSIPACMGFEIGEGFNVASLKGSEHNDLFILKKNKVVTKTNNCGGILAGISNGMPLHLKAAFKPTPSIGRLQETLNLKNEKKMLKMPSSHDLCLAIRACPVVEAMVAIVLADALLMNRCSKI